MWEDEQRGGFAVQVVGAEFGGDEALDSGQVGGFDEAKLVRGGVGAEG